MMRYLLATAILVITAACSNAQPGNANFADVTPAEAKKMMKENPELQIIDVRTDEECADGMIDGATQINIHDEDFVKRLEQLNKEKTYMVYCKAGGRSSRAQNLMKDLGFKRVYNLDGGYTAWME